MLILKKISNSAMHVRPCVLKNFEEYLTLLLLFTDVAFFMVFSISHLTKLCILILLLSINVIHRCRPRHGSLPNGYRDEEGRVLPESLDLS